MKKKKAAKRRAKKAPARPYVMPKTAAELGYNCAVCGQPAKWFDYKRDHNDTRQGVLCDSCPRSANNSKLLVKASVSENTEAR